jgi:branched-chain amino acid transport system ATP-binding protein
MTTPTLEVHEIAAGYGGTQALWDVSLAVAPRSLTCVLGPNGAGKTSLARVLAGSLRSWRGDVRVDGVSVSHWSPERRARAGIVHVPQGRRVFADLTVQENLRVALFAARKRASAETPEFVETLFPELPRRRQQLAGSLSGGEQQMLAVARALMAEPRLLILDEPSLGLAPILVENLYHAIQRIRERGVAILLIEQMVGAALAVADEVTVIESGRVVASGPAEVFRDVEVLARAYMGEGVRPEGAAGQDLA